MERLLLTILISLFISPLIAQVGINTENPISTLHINALNPSGSSTSVDGVLIPRVDRLRAQSMTGVQNSTLIYVNDVLTGTQTGQAVNIDNTGFYYFNSTSTTWEKLQATSTIIRQLPTTLFNRTNNVQVHGYGVGTSGGTNSASALFTDYLFTVPKTTLVENQNYISFYLRVSRSGGLGVWHTAIKFSLDGGTTWNNTNLVRWTGSPTSIIKSGRCFYNDGNLVFQTSEGEYFNLGAVNNTTSDITFGIFSGTDDFVTRATVDYAAFELVQ